MTVTVAEDGQVTLSRETVSSLGFAPGQELTIDSLPQGGAALHAKPVPRRQWTPEEMARIEAVIGYWKTDKQVSIKEMNETIAKGWAGLLDNDEDEDD